MSDARALYRAAFQHFANGRVDEAIAGYQAALAADPKLAIAWNGLSMAYRKQGKLEPATEAALKLIELEPDDALSHTNLSILYQLARDDPRSRRRKSARDAAPTQERPFLATIRNPSASEGGGRGWAAAK